MNIKSIKQEVLNGIIKEDLKGDMSAIDAANAAIDILSDLVWEEGKVVDVLMVHGKSRSKKIKLKKKVKNVR